MIGIYSETDHFTQKNQILLNFFILCDIFATKLSFDFIDF